MIHLAPHDGAHRAALRCAISVGAPMAIVAAFGRPDLLAPVAFGAFAAVFARGLTGFARAKVQAFAGVVMILSLCAGMAAAHLPGAPWGALAALVAIAVVVSVVGAAVAWKPPGPLFFVFAGGAYAGGAPLDPPQMAIAAGVAAATAAFAVAVGSIGAFRRRDRGPVRPLFELRPDRAMIAAALQTGFACALAGAIAVALGIHHVAWALLGAIVPVAVGRAGPWVTRGLHRALGTLVGVVVAAPLVFLDLPLPLVVVVAVLLQVGAELFVLRNYGLAMVFVTPLALLVVHAAQPAAPGALLQDRLTATVVGVVAGFAVLAALSRPWRRTLPA